MTSFQLYCASVVNSLCRLTHSSMYIYMQLCRYIQIGPPFLLPGKRIAHAQKFNNFVRAKFEFNMATKLNGIMRISVARIHYLPICLYPSESVSCWRFCFLKILMGPNSRHTYKPLGFRCCVLYCDCFYFTIKMGRVGDASAHLLRLHLLLFFNARKRDP